jgi:mannose-1-phosphate guanylyltransferase
MEDFLTIKIESLKEIYLIGFFQPNEDLNRFIVNAQNEFKISIRYLQEYKSLGTGGGIYHFRDLIRNGNPRCIFVINGDTAGDFPLQEMLQFHLNKQASSSFTILGTEATESQSVNYGCIVADPETNEVLHYVEKPESYLSKLINCGIYLFNLDIFDYIREELSRSNQAIDFMKYCLFYFSSKVSSSCRNFYKLFLTYNKSLSTPDYNYAKDSINLENKIFPSLCSTKKFYVFKNEDMWSPIKSAGYILIPIKCNFSNLSFSFLFY